MLLLITAIAAVLVLFLSAYQQTDETEKVIHEFERIQLSSVFYAEGAAIGDLNRDGQPDVIAGPYWYTGPDFQQRHAFYEPVEQDRLAYSENFIVDIEDVDGDGWEDILIVGFPGEAAYWYENPGNTDGYWPRNLIHPQVDNESPRFYDLTGDGQLELVFHTNGVLGFASWNESDPTALWTFTPVSGQWDWGRFTHGLGIGDINGDGFNDILKKEGWWENPGTDSQVNLWEYHQADFAADQQGGAQILVTDVDGDGYNDVITSLEAHGWGLAWYRQVRSDDTIEFEKNLIMGEAPEENPYGVAFSELHAFDLADMDGDGLKDFVTGKRWWAHGPQEGDHDPHGPAVLYWFKLDRSEDEVDFIPFLVDYDSGVGVEVETGELSGNGYPDIVVSNKKGTFVFLNRPKTIPKSVWEYLQPKRIHP